MLTGRWEPGTAAVCRALAEPGTVAADVGAHVGYFTRILAGAIGSSGRVFAFEPHPLNYEVLAYNTRKLPQVERIDRAVSNEDGLGYLLESEGSSDTHALAADSADGDGIRVRKIRLDSFLGDRGVRELGIAKIDVEGHELEVLQGMRKTLESSPRAAVIVEFTPTSSAGSEPGGLIEELRRADLDIYAIDEERVRLERVEVPPGPRDARRLSGHDHVNLLATRRDVSGAFLGAFS